MPMDATPTSPPEDIAVERIDVSAVNKRGERSLYEPRKRIHPKRAQGYFRRLKWAVMAATLAVYYLTPWIRWDFSDFRIFPDPSDLWIFEDLSDLSDSSLPDP